MHRIHVTYGDSRPHDVVNVVCFVPSGYNLNALAFGVRRSRWNVCRGGGKKGLRGGGGGGGAESPGEGGGGGACFNFHSERGGGPFPLTPSPPPLEPLPPSALSSSAAENLRFGNLFCDGKKEFSVP